MTRTFSIGQNLMPRSRLFAKLLTNPQKRIIFITAGNGYGKTSLLTAFFQQYDVAACWITLLTPIQTVQEFYRLLPDYKTGETMWIVVDNSENLHLNSSETNRLADWMEALPPYITIVLSGRSLLHELPISRWKIKKLALLLNKEELAFNKEESQEFLQISENLKTLHYLDQKVIEEVGGWPAGLGLLYQAGVKDRAADKPLYNCQHFNKDLSHYVENEVITKFSSGLQEFLLHISLLRNININLLKAYEPAWPVEEYMQELNGTNLFFWTDHTSTYHFTELFRKYFYDKAEQKWGKDEIQKRHLCLATLYRKRFQFVEALSQALAAEEDRLVIDVIIEMAERYEPEMFLQLLDGYLEKVTPHLYLSEISLFLFRCIPARLLGTLIQPLQSVIKRYENESPCANGELYHRLATIHFFQGELSEALTCSEVSLKIAEKQKNTRMIALNLSKLSKLHRFQGEHDAASTCSKQALALSEIHGFQHIQMHTLWNAAELSLDEKQFEKARRFAEQAIHVSTRCDKSSVVYPLCTMSRYYREKGELGEAVSYAEKALDHARQYDIQPDIGWAMAAIALCHQDMGNYKKAKNFMVQAIELFKDNTYFFKHFQNKLASIREHLNGSSELNTPNIVIGKVEEAPQPAGLKIQLLGTFTVEAGGKQLKIRRKACLRILLLFIVYKGRRWSKNELIGRLFPDDPEEAASNQFYVALSILRKIVEPGLEKGRDSRFILYSDATYTFCFDRVEVDIDVLKDLVRRPYHPEVVSQAIRMYKGDLLSEYPYEEWLEEERRNIREQFINALERWSMECIRLGYMKESINIIEKLLIVEPYYEEFQLKYVELLIQNRQIGKARLAAEKAVELFTSELGINLEPAFSNRFKQAKIKK